MSYCTSATALRKNFFSVLESKKREGAQLLVIAKHLSADPEEKPQGRNYNTAIDQTQEWKHKGTLITLVISTAVVTSTVTGVTKWANKCTGIKSELKMSKGSLEIMADFWKCYKIQTLKD